MVVKKPKNLVLISFIFLFLLISFASAQTYTQDTDVDIKVSCANIDCSTTTEISIEYPNTTLAIDNETMTTKDGFVNYTFSSTSDLGQYNYYLVSVGGTPEFYSDSFTITQTKTQFDTPQAIGYLIALLLMISFFALALYGAITLPFRNQRNSEGKIVSVNDLKYLKLFSIVMSYVFLMWIAGIAHKLTSSFLNVTGVENFFNFVFQVMLRLIWPIIVISFVALIFMIIDSRRIRRDLKRVGQMGLSKR